MLHELQVPLPLFVLSRHPEHDQDGRWMVTEETDVVAGGPEGALAFYTDADLAEQYAEQDGTVATVVEIFTQEAAAELARRMKAFHGCMTVAFAPSLGSPQPVTTPIEDFIAACESSP